MSRILKVISLLLFFSNIAVAQNDVAMLAESCSLLGQRSYLRPGIYRTSQLGIRDNSLSSFYLPDGMALQVFESDSYRGKTETFYSSVECLPYSWNNRVSSIKLFWVTEPSYPGSGIVPPLQGNSVIVYRDRNYGGPSMVLPPGNFGPQTLGPFAGNISSIYIPNGVTVKMIDRNNQSLFINTSTVDLGVHRWDKRIWSGVVEGNNTGGGASGTRPPQGSSVILYRDLNFSGPSVVMSIGGFSSMNMGGLANQISSVYIPYGVTLQVFDRSGVIHHFTSSISNLNAYSWDNRINSGSVFNNVSVQETVNLYADPNYRGEMISCKEGRTNYIINNPGITSIQVPRGFGVTVYSGPNLTGNYRTFKSSVASLAAYPGWDNRVMSVFVFRL